MKNGDYVLVIAPEWYKGKRYRGRYCYEHHLAWEKHTGLSVPDGCIVHHKDGNKHNNNINNLQLMEAKTHVAMHAKKGRTVLELKCPSCGKHFIKEKRNCFRKKRIMFCSRQCVGKMYSFNRPTEEQIKKAIEENVVREFILG